MWVGACRVWGHEAVLLPPSDAQSTLAGLAVPKRIGGTGTPWHSNLSLLGCCRGACFPLHQPVEHTLMSPVWGQCQPNLPALPTGRALALAKKTSASGNPIMAVILSWLVVQVSLGMLLAHLGLSGDGDLCPALGALSWDAPGSGSRCVPRALRSWCSSPGSSTPSRGSSPLSSCWFMPLSTWPAWRWSGHRPPTSGTCWPGGEGGCSAVLGGHHSSLCKELGGEKHPHPSGGRRGQPPCPGTVILSG